MIPKSDPVKRWKGSRVGYASRLITGFAAGLAGVVVSLPGEARAVEYTEIVAVGDPVPGGSGSFSDGFQYPFFSVGTSYFLNMGENTDDALFSWTEAGGVQKLYGADTAIPMGVGNFTEIGDVATQYGFAAFRGQGSGGQIGLYLSGGGNLSMIADLATAAPGGGGLFTGFGAAPSVGLTSAGGAVFYGTSSHGGGIYYRNPTGTLSVLVDHDTPIPGGGGSNFHLDTDSSEISVSGDNAYFFAGNTDPSLRGLYGVNLVTGDVSQVQLVTPSFQAFTSPQAGGDRVAFIALKGDNAYALEYWVNGVETSILTTNDKVPGTEKGIGAFDFDLAVNEDGDIAFTIYDVDGNPYIYSYYNDQFVRVADVDTVLDGKKPMPGLPSLGLRADSFSGDQVAFYTLLGPGDNALYLGTVPEPSAFAFLLTAGAFGMAVFLRRRRKCGV